MEALIASVVAALVAIGVTPERAAEHADSSSYNGASHMEWLLSDITRNPEWYRPETTAVKACGCGRAHSAEAFEALPAPAAGGTIDDGDGGVLILRNCPCGSTLARQGTDEDVLSSDPAFTEVCDERAAATLDHMEQRALSALRVEAAQFEVLQVAS